MTDVTKDDLRDVRDTILTEMRDGFRGTNGRLDLLNGRVGRGEQGVARVDVRVKNLEREVFERPQPRVISAPGSIDAAVLAAEQRPALTRREVQVLVWVLGGVVAVCELLLRVLPHLRTMWP